MKDTLKILGLNERESQVYLTLLKEQTSNASSLARLTKINRTTVYLELENLIKRGLVSFATKNNVREFRAANPEKFLQIMNTQKERFENILPQLQSLYNPSNTYNVEVFEGKEGIKTFYQDIYQNAKEFYVLGATGKATEVLKFEYPHFMQEFIAKNITEKVIANFDSKAIFQKHPSSHVAVKYLPKKHKSFVTTILYNGKVAIQSLQEKVYVIIIADSLLYQTYKNQFDLLWKLL